MRRLALTLATAVLASGCIIGDHDDDHTPYPPPGGLGSVIVYWDFVRNAPAQPQGRIVYDFDLEGPGTGACAESAVELVTVDVAGVPQYVVDCTYQGVQGATLDLVPSGAQPARIRGWRGDFAVYESSVTLNVVPDQVTEQPVVDVEAVRAPIDLFAYLASVSPPTDYLTCAEAGNPNLSYRLWDSLGTEIDGATVGCEGPLPAPVFVGDLDLDNYVVRMQGIATAGPDSGKVVFDSCDYAFDHFDAQVGEAGFAPTLLTRPVPTCQ